MSEAQWIESDYATPNITMEKRENGEIILASADALEDGDAHVGVWLRQWAKITPEYTFLAERDGTGEWRRLSYAAARSGADAIAQGLLDRGLGPDRPVMILSGNSIDHGLLTLGCLCAGVPVVPVSPAYSLMSQDHAKVQHVFDTCHPGLIYVANGEMFAGALNSINLDGVEVVVGASPPKGIKTTNFADLLKTSPGPAAGQAFDSIGPDTVAKILFTSGSTGMPKGVINTQRMLCASQQSLVQCWPFLEDGPPILVDWLPWNHTFGGNNNFNMVLRNGGAIYIDAGKPAPGLIEQSVANLHDVSPSIYYNVPAGFGVILPYLEADDELRDKFFKNLKLIMYAGAALPVDLWERLEDLSIKSLGQPVVLSSAWGSTETAPMATMAHFLLESSGNIGVPVPGVTIKMVPSGDKMELRVTGSNITPGYLGRDDLTKAAFDEEGYYCIGDAGRLVDPDDPNKGIMFDGRVAEDFKLLSGTWVAVGSLRVELIAACSPLLQDAVVAGHDRDEIGLLIWPNLPACRTLAGLAEDVPAPDVVENEKVRAQIIQSLTTHNAAAGGSSRRVARAILMTEPASIDTNEITDKGYINQRATLENRAHLVDALYADQPGPDVLVIPRG